MLEVPIDAMLGGGQDPETERADAQMRLQLFGERLQKLFDQQVAEKAGTEERFLEDLRQYNGEYDAEVLSKIRQAGGSEAVLNFTRVKCNAVESRLGEQLVPTDDRNFTAEPTPIPEFTIAMRDRSIVKGIDGQPMLKDDGTPYTKAEATLAIQAQAKAAAELMVAEMDDQLAECSYNAVQRNVIHNMVVYGTGILKGPVLRNRVQKKYSRTRVPDPVTGLAVEQWQMQVFEDLAPGAESVSPWDFFPDMRATRMEEAEFVFERHRYNSAQLRDLAKLPHVLVDQVNELLEAEPRGTLSGLIDQAIAPLTGSARTRGRYEVVEYHGPIDKEDLLAAGADIDPSDNLTVYDGVVLFSQGKVLKAVRSMLDDNSGMYDAVPLERDDTSIFGLGVPRLMHHTAKVGNSAWRMVLDNARATVGPIMVWKQGKFKPHQSNDYRWAPFKQYEVTDPNSAINDVFGVFHANANFTTMFELLNMVRAFNDEETGLPQIAQGQQSPAITKTAQGMAILMNSANTMLRRMVKEYDDCLTSRFIRRLYAWNMQYSDNEAAKGDFTIVPLGSVSLMIREQQTQGLMQLAQLAMTNPEFAMRTKWGDLYRTMVKAMNINADTHIKTEEEFKREQEAQAKQPPQLPPEVQLKMAEIEIEKAKLELQKAQDAHEAQLATARLQYEERAMVAKTNAELEAVRSRRDADVRRADASLAAAKAAMAKVISEHEVALLSLAAEREMTVEQVRKEFGLKAMDIESDHQKFNASRADSKARDARQMALEDAGTEAE